MRRVRLMWHWWRRPAVGRRPPPPRWPRKHLTVVVPSGSRGPNGMTVVAFAVYSRILSKPDRTKNKKYPSNEKIVSFFQQRNVSITRNCKVSCVKQCSAPTPIFQFSFLSVLVRLTWSHIPPRSPHPLSMPLPTPPAPWQWWTPLPTPGVRQSPRIPVQAEYPLSARWSPTACATA